ncbi:MAG: hypothetical protein DMF93_17335 [Acidobacteria bacterium]|nr:MAG: hypothetical protein DMF93_17335 [Acidobacteriota bacterium]
METAFVPLMTYSTPARPSIVVAPVRRKGMPPRSMRSVVGTAAALPWANHLICAVSSRRTSMRPR